MLAWRPGDRDPRLPGWAASGPCRRSSGGRPSRPQTPPTPPPQARPHRSPLAETIHKIVKICQQLKSLQRIGNNQSIKTYYYKIILNNFYTPLPQRPQRMRQARAGQHAAYHRDLRVRRSAPPRPPPPRPPPPRP